MLHHAFLSDAAGRVPPLRFRAAALNPFLHRMCSLAAGVTAINPSLRRTLQEQFFRTINGFGRDYGSLAKVPALQWLVTFDTVGMRPAKIPAFVWRTAVRHVAVPAARLAGFRPFLDDYLAAAAKQHRLGAAAE